MSTSTSVAAPAPAPWWRRRRVPAPWVTLPTLAYLLLVLLGVTTSSIGIGTLRVDPTSRGGDQLFGSVSIRTDEYLTSSPLALGVTATGDAEDLNPLTAPQGFTTQFPSTPVSSVVLADGALLRLGTVLPDQMLFAARWWLPTLLLFLGAPAFFRSLVGSRWPGLFAAVLITFSPATAWWSLGPLGVLGFTLAGAAALQRCADSAAARAPWWRTALWGVGGALLLARTPLHYQPWAIVVAPVVLAVAIVPLLVEREARRRRVVAVVATGVASLLLAAAVFWENRASLAAATGTVYPGARVSGGSALRFEEIFGGTAMGTLRGLEVVGSNPSELSQSFAVASVVAVLLLVVGVQFRSVRHRAAVLTLLVASAPWWLWCMVAFGGIGEHIPLMNLVPPSRAADMVGYLAVLLLCLVLPALADRTPLRVSSGAAVAAAVVAAYAGSLLTTGFLPGLMVRSVWLSSLVVGAVVFLLVHRPRRWGGYVAAGLAAFLLVWHVNPVLVGLADLRGSAIAQELMEEGAQTRDDGTLWATDDVAVDSLLTATGVPALTGRQMSGPDVDEWERLDPGAAHEGVWNRGGSFITFVWTEQPGLAFDNPAPDVIRITGSPCTVAELMPELDTVVSGTELSGECLVPEGTIEWGGKQHLVYGVHG